MKDIPNKELPESLVSEEKIRRRIFISFSAFAGLNLAAFGLWKWLRHSPPEPRGVTAGVQSPIRKVLNANETVARKVFSHKHLAKTYPKKMAVRRVRPNGFEGLKSPLDVANWKLSVTKASGENLLISLDEIKALPKTEIVFDFKCVEGWSQIQYWGGVKFSDFMEHFGLNQETHFEYVGMETPDKKYYVGVDMESAMHPQTLLAYEMTGYPLISRHGAPLRLMMPVKYGIKNLKRIGTIFFSNDRPKDYWAENGYDYYSGL